MIISPNYFCLGILYSNLLSAKGQITVKRPFSEKRNTFLNKLRSPEFSFFELNHSFLLFLHTLVMPKNYPQAIFMKIVEVVIYLEILDFFQKKIRFL